MAKRHARRIVSLLLAAVILLLLWSCAERKAEPENSDDEIIFTPIETDGAKPAEQSDAGLPSQTEPEETTPEPATEPEDETTAEPFREPVEVTEEVIIIGDEPETAAPAYQQQIPTGGGRAPLALMYHLVLDEPFSSLESLFVRPSELRGHIEALLEKGYTFIFADEYGYYDGKTVVMSFDDGYLDNYTEVFPIIKQYNVKITIFMITNYINGADYLSEDMIREMSSSGLVSFQSHTCSHPNLTTISEDSMRYEFSTSNQMLEYLTGRPVTALCYPTGAYNAAVASVATGYYKFAYTTVSTSSTQGYPLMELPRLRVNRGFSKDYFASIIP